VGRCCLFYCTYITCERANNIPLHCQQDGAWPCLWPVFAVLQQSQSRCYTKGLGSGAGRRSVPQKQARTFSETLSALSLPLRPLFQRVCRCAATDTDSFSARCQNREGHSPLAIHTAAFVHVLVLLAAGFALCFGESINLTLLDSHRQRTRIIDYYLITQPLE
jgi:hypothetical protein